MSMTKSSKLKVFMFVNVDWFFLSHRFSIANEASRNGIDMTVYADMTGKTSLNLQKNFSFLQSPLSRSSKNLFVLFYEFIKVMYLICKEKPEVIHAVTIKPIILLGITARLTKTPFLGAISGMGPIIKDEGLFSRLRFKIVLKIYKFIFKPANTIVICQSDHDRNILMNHNICNEYSITKIAGSGVNLEKFKPTQNKQDRPVILMASRILLDKGVREFCFSAKSFLKDGNQADFWLAGPIDNSSPSFLSQEDTVILCEENGVNYLGDQDDMDKLFALTTIFVLPSYYPEGIPKVLLEAAASGLPIITTDHPGCRDAVINGKTAILVETRDAKAIDNAVRYLLNNPNLISEMGKAGRSLAEDRYDERKVITSHLELYNRLIRFSR